MPAEPRVDVPTLLGLGLDEHLSEVWLAMAAAPGAGVRELADLVGISESQVREVLDELGDRALIRASRQSPGLLVPIAPQAALAQLLRREAEEIAEQQRWVQARRDRIMRGIVTKVAGRIAASDGDCGSASDNGSASPAADVAADIAELAADLVAATAATSTATAPTTATKTSTATTAATASIGDPDDLAAAAPRRPAIEPVTGEAAIQAAFEHLAHSAKVCVDHLAPCARFSESAVTQAAAMDGSLLQRGIRMRSLYLDAIHDDPLSADYARTLQAAGAQVRTSPALPQGLFVADRRVALVPLDSAVHACGAVVVRAPGVVAALVELFDAIWHNAAPLDIGRDIGLSHTERSLLRLFAEGASDERAAKKLGLSLRTVRRIMADLMHRLDASSRFEAGIKAAKRGWL